MRTKIRRGQKGSVAIMTAIFMVMLLGIAALALDIGNLAVARGELQNAADATALAGAECLYRRTQCNNMPDAEPTWSAAASEASAFVPRNAVQNVAVQAVQVNTGYWNVTGNPSGLEGLPMTPGPNDYPAIQVTITKDGSNANGSVPTYLAGIFGFNSLKASATATAVISSPGYVGPGGLFPFALGQCLYNTFWNSTTNSPDLYQTGDQEPDGQPSISQTAGQPWIFAVGSTYHVGNCTSGQWTSFYTNSQSASDISNMFPPPSGTGNLAGVSVNDTIWMKSGDASSLYHQVASCAAGTGDGSCAWETVPVVADPSQTGQAVAVTAFACMHILGETGSGTNAYITIQMSADTSKCSTPNSGGAGHNYGALTPPKLVQ